MHKTSIILLVAGGATAVAPANAATMLPGAAESTEHAMTCLATAIAYEAATEPVRGQQAVAQVILNRARHPAFPKSICGVVYQGAARRTGCQFTFTCDGSLSRRLSARTVATARSVAASALEGRLPATVGAATHYHANYVLPRWASALVRVDRIGAHIFYRFPGQHGDTVSTSSHPAPAATAPRGGSAFRPWGLALPAAPGS